MKKVFFSLIAFALSSISLCAQQRVDSMKQVQLEEVTVSAVRVSTSSSVAHSNMDQQQIKSDNAAKNVPQLLQSLPSVVSYTEGGTSVGNTSFRIRGTDANRINMTLNGMPLNNPETQEVYWVNLPDLSNSLKTLQVQRGVGTASTGTASFGGAISMQTTGAQAKPYAELSTSYGHYNTFLLSAATGTGIHKNGLSLDARYSYTLSDGYIRNGKVDHKNLYASVSHFTDKQMLKLVYINGIQHTGITWEGVSPEEKAIDRRYNPAGEYIDDDGVTRYYDNETDNYYSHVVQAQYSRLIADYITFNANLGFNSGYGYYENYKVDQKFNKFGLANQIINTVEYDRSDVIRRKLMSNNLYSGGANLNYKGDNTEISVGVNYTYFEGDHYGRLLWVKHNNNIGENLEWYRNKADKTDMNSFLKVSYNPIKQLSLISELQGRAVSYKMSGIDDDMATLEADNLYMYFNPKIGTVYHLNQMNEFYFSFGISNREPLRSDLKESIKGDNPRGIKSERLLDYELGYRYTTPSLSVTTNLYYMRYKDQLVQTGKLSDTGYKFQENIPKSYRYGIEIEAMYNPLYWLGVGGNITLSKNKIKNYTAYNDYYEYNEQKKKWEMTGQVSQFYKKSNISYSPDVVGSAIITLKPIKEKDLRFTFTNKYVGSMYYDNTSNNEHKLSDYFTTNFQASHSISVGKIKKLEMQLMVNNIFNKKYDANAWVSTDVYANGTKTIYKGLFPQAGTNVMGRVSISF